MAKTVVGLYDELSEARRVVEELVDAGFKREDVSLVARDPEGRHGRELETRETTHHEGMDAGTGAATGAVSGGIIGGLTGLLLGLGAFTIPGVGPIIAAGPIVAGLTGAGVGIVAGGIVGALVGWGIPEEEAHYYAEGVRRGGTLVAVKTPDNQVDRVTQIMNRHNPVDIEERASQWREAGWTGYDETAQPYTPAEIEEHRTRYRQAGAGKKSIPVVEEDMRVGKRETEQDRIRVRSYMTETPVEEDVHLHEERVNVERRPADRPASKKDLDAFKEESFEVAETREEVIAEKRPRVVEEVVVEKEGRDRTEKVRDTVRRTDVDVEHVGTERRGDGYTFDTYRDSFRRHYDTNYANTNYSYTDYDKAGYRYGYDLAMDERYRNKSWAEVEPEARRDWNTRFRNVGSWEEFKDSIRHAWNSVTGSGEHSGDYHTYRSDFQTHYNTNYADTDYDYTYYEPGYRYGYNLASEDRYRNRSWEEIEPESRRDWEKNRKGTWDQFKDTIRYGWNRSTSGRREKEPVVRRERS